MHKITSEDALYVQKLRENKNVPPPPLNDDFPGVRHECVTLTHTNQFYV